MRVRDHNGAARERSDHVPADAASRAPRAAAADAPAFDEAVERAHACVMVATRVELRRAHARAEGDRDGLAGGEGRCCRACAQLAVRIVAPAADRT